MSGRRIALLDLGERPSLAGHALAAQLEQAIEGLLVQVVLVPLRTPQGRGAELAARTFDRALERVLAFEPELCVLGCDLWNIESVLSLCTRTRTLAPGIEIVLGGPEACARRAELEARVDVDRVLAGPAPLALCTHLGGPRRRRSGQGAEARYAQRVAELARSEPPRPRAAWLVEAEWSARLPLPLARVTGVLEPALTVDAALRRLLPARRAALPVRLASPALVARREHLEPLLHALALAPQQGRLELELPAPLLDLELAAMLCAAGVSVVEVELDALPAGRREPPARFRAAIDLLASRGVTLRGTVLRPAPGRDHPALRRLVDRALRAGLEELRTLRLVCPPGSPLRARSAAEGLRCSPRPPYEVFALRGCGFDEALRGARLGVTLEQLAPSLASTGLLRALATDGSAAELCEGFGESLAARGADPLEGPPRVAVDRAFVDYLREHHRIDLTREEGRTRLVRAPYLSMRWLRDGRRLVSDDTTGRNAHLGRHALAVLDRFDSAQTATAVCEQLLGRLSAHAGPEARSRLRRELRRTLEKLTSMSFLVPAQDALATELEADVEGPFTCLEEFDFHYRMLSDAVRMEAYRRAILAAVVPGQHAVEVGTGTGILAVLAAQAGARVTAIERFSILGMARAVARRNGVADRIRLVRGRSDLVQLDEPGDLLISEIVGNRILNEGLLESTLDARRRLLKPGARLIPCRLTILAEVGRAGRFEAIPDELARISAAHGVDLAPLTAWFRERIALGQVVWELSGEGEDFVSFADEVPVIAIDLEHFEEAEFVREVRIEPRRAGAANAVVLAFRLELQPGIELSTSGRHPLHWSKPVFMLRDPVEARPGRPLRLRVSYETQGELDVTLTVDDGLHQSGTKSSLEASASSSASRPRSATTSRPPSGGSTTSRKSAPR
jgi:precorrin-6B methylase 2